MHRHAAAAVALVALGGGTWTAGQSAPPPGALTASIDANAGRYAAVAKQIWGFAELGFQEEKIRATLIDPTAPMGTQTVVQSMQPGTVGAASTDLGDISWNVPAVHMNAATFVPGVPAHTWQAVACAGSSIGIKGMLVAAKAMALTVSDLYGDPGILAAAKEEMERRRGGAAFKYSTLAPARPPLDYRKGP